jgi:hypothetical protein
MTTVKQYVNSELKSLLLDLSWVTGWRSYWAYVLSMLEPSDDTGEGACDSTGAS